MKIREVTANNRRRAFELTTQGGAYAFPYSRLRVAPTRGNRVAEVYVDRELGSEAFTYRLEDGSEDSIHLDAVLDYNRDPGHLTELLLHRLSVEAGRRIEASGLSHRELIRRLGTSASQFYRLLDPTNTTKSVGQMVALLDILGCDVEIVVRDRERSA